MKSRNTSTEVETLRAALDEASRLLVASELAWRSQLAVAVALGGMSVGFAKELTQGAIDDTKTLMLGGSIEPNGLRIGDENSQKMAENLGDLVDEIADEMERLDA